MTTPIRITDQITHSWDGGVTAVVYIIYTQVVSLRTVDSQLNMPVMDRWFVTTMNVCTVLKSTQTINLGGERASITFALEYIILWKPAAIVFCSNTTRTKVEIYWIASFQKK